VTIKNGRTKGAKGKKRAKDETAGVYIADKIQEGGSVSDRPGVLRYIVFGFSGGIAEETAFPVRRVRTFFKILEILCLPLS